MTKHKFKRNDWVVFGLDLWFSGYKDELDKWNDSTGVFPNDSGYYYEIQSVIEDAVHIGIQMAIYGNVEYEDGEVKRIDKNIRNKGDFEINPSPPQS